MSRKVLSASPLALAAALISLLSVSAGGAGASDERLTVSNPPYRAECGSCHVAYPPALLSTTTWDKILGSLGTHFGTDATVEAKTLEEIRAFLARHAAKAPSGAASPATLRITETRWFVHEHEEVPPAIWQKPDVKSPANCGACHRRAADGDYGKRNIRVPR